MNKKPSGPSQDEERPKRRWLTKGRMVKYAQETLKNRSIEEGCFDLPLLEHNAEDPVDSSSLRHEPKTGQGGCTALYGIVAP